MLSSARGLNFFTDLQTGILPGFPGILEDLMRHNENRNTAHVPSSQTIGGWLELEKCLPIFPSVLEMGSCCEAQDGLEVMSSSSVSTSASGAGGTLGSY